MVSVQFCKKFTGPTFFFFGKGEGEGCVCGVCRGVEGGGGGRVKEGRGSGGPTIFKLLADIPFENGLQNFLS